MTTLRYILSEIKNAKVQKTEEYPEIWLRIPIEVGLPLAQQRLNSDYNESNYQEREVFIHIVFYNDNKDIYIVSLWDNSGNEEILFTDKKIYPIQEEIIQKFNES